MLRHRASRGTQSPPKPRRRRRQWGSDRRVAPLPAYTRPPTDRALAASRLAMVVTVAAWIAYVVTTIIRQFINNGTQSMRFTSEAVSYLLVVTLLTSSAMAYLVARHGFLVRTRAHRRAPRAAIDDHFSRSMPTLTVLVPAYKEEARVIRQTLLSAALQEYPFQRIVLLIDDPPDPERRRTTSSSSPRPWPCPAEITELLARAPCLGRSGARRPRAAGRRRPRPDGRPRRGGRGGVPRRVRLLGASSSPTRGRVGGRPHRRSSWPTTCSAAWPPTSGVGDALTAAAAEGTVARPGPPPPAPPPPGVDLPHRGRVPSSASGTPTSRTSPTRR